MSTKGQAFHCDPASSRNYLKRPPVVERPKCEAKPHMSAGLTKEMLMGARAPVAKLRRSE